MPEIIFSLIMAMIVGFFGVSFFPPVHDMISSIDVTSLPYLLKAMVTFMPYVIVFTIVYGITLIFKRRSQ